MRRKPVELAGSSKAGDALQQANGSIRISRGRDRISLPKDWIDTLRRNGIPLIVFLNQAVVSDGDCEKIEEVTKKVKELYGKVVARLEKTNKKGLLGRLFGGDDTYKEAASAIRYYKELEETGELPNKCINPPSWDAQLKISDRIVDVLREEFKIIDPAHDIMYDMHHGTKGIANCLIMCLYYVTIARRLGMHAELYRMPSHAIVGLHSGKKIQLVDPGMNIKRAERGALTIKTPDGEFRIDYRKIRSADCYGLAGAWESKGDVHSNLADEQAKKGDLEKARKTYEKAIDSYEKAAAIDRRKITTVSMLTEKGGVLEKLGDLETKRGDCKKAIETYEKAVKECEKALRIEKDFTPARHIKERTEERLSQLK